MKFGYSDLFEVHDLENENCNDFIYDEEDYYDGYSNVTHYYDNEYNEDDYYRYYYSR